jgi:hypothetical protein
MDTETTATVPAEVSKVPEPTKLTSWTAPEGTQRILKLIDQGYDSCIYRIGRLEAEYLNSKDALFTELQTLKKEHAKILGAAAKEAGVDIATERWLFDPKTATLTLEASVTKP